MNTKRYLSIVMTIALITMMFVPTGLAEGVGTAEPPASVPSDSPPAEPTAKPEEPMTDPSEEPMADPNAERPPDPTQEPAAEPTTKYTVEFVDWDGSLITSLSVEKGADAVAPEHPVRLGYLADGWDTDFTNVQKDLTVTALYVSTNIEKGTDLDSAMLLAAELSYTVHLYVYVGNAPHNPPLLVHYTLTDITDTGLATLQGNQNWSTFFTNLSNATGVNLSNYIGLSASQYYGNGKISLSNLGNNEYEVKVYLKDGSISTTYTVHYVDEDNNTVFPSVTKSGDVGDIVTESAPAANGYVTPADKSITLGFSGNVITFVYKANAYTVTWNDYDGTQLEQDLNVLYGATPSFDGATPTRAATAEFTYTFSGWTPAVSPVTGNVTYTATYTEETNAYTVTWNDYDGTQLEQDLNVLYGATPSFDGATPTRAATAEFTYTFSGWTPAVSPVTGNVTYTATYTEETNAYTVTWNDYDGVQLEQDLNVLYGATPSYNGATPTRAATAQFTYTFSGWTPAVSPVTGNVTYTATYTEETNAYTVTWNDYDGTQLEQDLNVLYGETPSFDGATPTRAATAQFTYTFSGWTPAVSPVTGNVTYTATYTAATNAYTVTWNNFNGVQLEQDLNVLYGATPSYNSATPTRAATAQFTYAFSGWTPAVSPVTGNVTYTAAYTAAANAYTVTWNNFNGVQLEQDLNVLYGATPSYNSATPTRAATAQFTYAFSGWTPAVSPVTGNVTYTAAYTAAANAFTVTFVNFDGTVLGTDTVSYGGTAEAPADPTREGYTFTGWDIDFDNVTSDLTVTAQYTIITFTVTFVDFDGAVLDTQEVPFGGAAQAPADPTRDGYTFTGWDISFDPVTGDLTVTALYELIPVQVDEEEIPLTIDDEPIPESGPRENLNWMWWLLLLLLIPLLLLWYNVTVTVFGLDEDGKEKSLRRIRRLKRKKDEVTVSLKASHVRGGEYGAVELTKLFTRRMRGNRLIVDVDGEVVLNAVVPDDAEGRFSVRVEKW